MNKEILNNLIDKINSHDIDGIMAAISSDHTFIDAHGNKATGHDMISMGWKYHFSIFPDYKIEINEVFENGNIIVAIGFAGGSFEGKSTDAGKSWKLPASFRAEIVDGKVKSWQIYSDTKTPFDIISKEQFNRPASPDGITGLGGVFFKAKDRKTLMEWYDKHLGTQFAGQMSHGFKWRDRNNPQNIGRTEFGIFSDKTKYFEPGTKDYMLNFRVGNLPELLEKLKKEGVQVVGNMEVYEYGKFGWIMDPEGNKIELWEPVDEILEK